MGFFFLPGAVAVLLGVLAVIAWIFGGKSDSGKLSVGEIGYEGPKGFILNIFGFAIMGMQSTMVGKPMDPGARGSFRGWKTASKRN